MRLIALLVSIPLVMGATPAWVVSGSVGDVVATSDAIWALKYGKDGFGSARFGRYEPDAGWTVHPAPGTAPNTLVTQLAMSGPDDGWAIGSYPDAYLAHWDGVSWQRQAPVGDLRTDDQIFDISARAADDMWLVGYRERYRIWHWDGVTFEEMSVPFASPGFPADIVALDDDDVWVVGFVAGVEPAAAHWDGSSWTVVELSELDQWPSMVTASSPTSIWATPGGVQTGDDLATVHWDGAQWQTVDVPRDDLRVKDIAASADGGAWLVAAGPWDWQSMLWRSDGSTWTRVSLPQLCGGGSHAQLRTVETAGDELYVGGACRHHSGDHATYTLILRYDGQRWTRI